MFEALRVLLVVELIGLAAVPLAGFLLGRLPGGGFAFAKPLGLLAAAYPVWLLASLGPIVPYGTGTAVAGVLVLCAGGAAVWRRRGGPWRLQDRRLLAGAEVLFVVAFAVAALAVSFAGDVRGTEKPMDMAFMTAINASAGFPPHDPWFAGETLNYYYFGQYVMAFVVRLAGVEPAVGYNLALALTFALSAVAAYALASSLTAAAGGRRPVLVGVGAALFVCVAGNMDGAQRLLAGGGGLSAYDWFGPSRVIPDTITEFPAFSFLLGDLHAHVVAIPFTLLALGFALQVALTGPRRRDLVPAGIAVGALYAINSWSYPVVAGIVVAAGVLWLRDPARVTSYRRAGEWAVGVLWISMLAFLPFWLGFDPAARGIGLVGDRRGLALFLSDQTLIYGAVAWILAASFAQRLLDLHHPGRTAAWVGVAGVVVGSLLAPSDLAGAMLVAGATAWATWTAVTRRLAAERFGWLLIAAGLACILGPELVYVRDEFDGSALYRMNTVFKLGYQAWILLAVMAAAVLPWGRLWLPEAVWRVWAPVAAIGLAAAAVYLPAGTYARTGGFREGPSLDGLRWLEREAPGDVAAIEWLREHAASDAVVLEAVGDDYSAFGHARISTFSGRPTVMGWTGHELQWGHDPGTRREQVAQIYRAATAGEIGALLVRYRIAYVVAGPLERTDYGVDGLAKFDGLGRRVFERDGTTVWRLRGRR